MGESVGPAGIVLAWDDDEGAHALPLPPRGVLSLGRDPTCDAVLANLSVSRRHAEMGVDEAGRAYVRHLSRKSPTWLNGALIMGQAPLAPGDVLRLGIVELRIVAG